MSSLAKTHHFSPFQPHINDGCNVNFDDVVKYINDRNDGSTAWDGGYFESATLNPVLRVNNSTGTNDIARFQDNATSVLTIANSGATTIRAIDGTAVVPLTVNNGTSTGAIFIAQDNGSAIMTIADGGALTYDGAAVFNEAGADKDFRMEGDTNANLFFVDASADGVGIGTNTPTGFLNVKGTGGDAMPATSGGTQSAGLIARLQQGGAIGSVMDIGGNGGSGSWIQVTEASNLATNYSLLLNPNGGSVGIGTTGPGASLDVAPTSVGGQVVSRVFNADNTNSASDSKFTIVSGGSSGGDPLLNWLVTAQTNWTMGIDNSDSDKLKIAESATLGTVNDRLTIATGGNVGIGTTGPAAKMDVQAAVSATPITNGIVRIVGTGANPATGSGGGLLFAQQDSGGNFINYASLTGSRVDVTANNKVNLNINTGSPDDGIALATRITIDTSGNVGIGTTGPQRPLHVHTAAEANFYIRTGSEFGAGYSGVAIDSINDAANSRNMLVVAGNPTVLTAGNVGIGTTGPGQVLDVRGAIVTNALPAVQTLANALFLGGGNSTYQGGHYIAQGPNATTAGAHAFWTAESDSGAGTIRLVIDATATAGQTALLLYDVDNATLERVTVGAADSGGAGFKVLRIPN